MKKVYVWGLFGLILITFLGLFICKLLEKDPFSRFIGDQYRPLVSDVKNQRKFSGDYDLYVTYIMFRTSPENMNRIVNELGYQDYFEMMLATESEEKENIKKERELGENKALFRITWQSKKDPNVHYLYETQTYSINSKPPSWWNLSNLEKDKTIMFWNKSAYLNHENKYMLYDPESHIAYFYSEK